MEYPKMLYKYFSFNENSLRCLREQSLWFAAPFSFNDPFDCDFRILNSSPDRFTMPIGMGVDLLVENFQSWKDNGEGIDTFARYRQKLEAALRNIGVLCLTPNATSLLMWSHYSYSHTGFCLGFEYNPLECMFKL